MTFLSKNNYKWAIIIFFLGIIIAPSLVPSPTFKTISLGVFGGGALFFEFLSLRSLRSNEANYRTDFRQTLLLILLTILLLVVNVVI